MLRLFSLQVPNLSIPLFCPHAHTSARYELRQQQKKRKRERKSGIRNGERKGERNGREARFGFFFLPRTCVVLAPLGFSVPPYVITEARVARSRLSKRPSGPDEVKDFLFRHPEISTWMDLSTYVDTGVKSSPESMELRRLDHFLSKTGGKEVRRPPFRPKLHSFVEYRQPTTRNPDAPRPRNLETLETQTRNIL